MAYNGTNGTYSLPAGNPVVTGTSISSTVQNNTTSDIATALSTAICKDGQTTATANLPMGGFKHTSVAIAAALTDYMSATDGQKGTPTYLTSVAGTADAITATAPYTMAAYTTGQYFRFIAASSNTSTVTINVNSIGAKAITKRGTTGLAAGDISANETVSIVYDGTQFQLVGPPSAYNLPRSARTANTILAASDKGTFIEITSGTFSQTFTAAATLATGWWCIYYNSGTGAITLEPDGSEQIDGLTNYIVYPGESRLIACTGTAFETVILNPFNYTFTATGTFTTPPGYRYFAGLLWGAGGSGGKFNGNVGGGGGGCCLPFQLLASAFGATETITIGAGGAAQTGAGADGTVGGNSSIGSLATSYGGGGGDGAGALAGGGGGGALSAGSNTGAAGDPRYSGVTLGGGNPGLGGASGARYDTLAEGGYGGYGGGGGGSNGAGGKSVFGGGGGGGSGATGANAGGTSVFGGAGGASVVAGAGGVAGTAPAGGGGATQTGTASGAGARGELRIWGL